MPSAAKLFGEAWKVYTKNFGVLAAIAFIPAVFVVLAHFLHLAIPATDSQPLIIGLAFVGIFGLLILAWSCGAMMKAMQSIDSTGKAAFFAAYGQGLDRMWPLVGLVLLTILIVGVGTILLIIPGIIFFIWFSLGIYAFAFEKLGIGWSLSASKQYVYQHFWNTLWKWIFAFIIYALFEVVLALIFAEISVMFNLSQDILAYIMNTLAAIISTPFFIVYGYLIYHYLKGIYQVAPVG